MFHQHVLNLIIYGGILSIILSIIVCPIKNGGVEPILLAIGMFFICVIIPILVYGAFENVSGSVHQREGYANIQLSSVDFVFSRVANEIDFTYYDRDPKQSFGFPDSWYDENGELGRNIDFEILSRTQVEIAFFNLDNDLCRNIQRLARMHNGQLLDPRSCDDSNSVAVLFGS